MDIKNKQTEREEDAVVVVAKRPVENEKDRFFLCMIFNLLS